MKKKRIELIIALSLLRTHVISSIIKAYHGFQKDLSGSVFTLLYRNVYMPQEWIKQPVKYESTYDTDLIIILAQHWRAR